MRPHTSHFSRDKILPRILSRPRSSVVAFGATGDVEFPSIAKMKKKSTLSVFSENMNKRLGEVANKMNEYEAKKFSKVVKQKKEKSRDDLAKFLPKRLKLRESFNEKVAFDEIEEMLNNFRGVKKRTEVKKFAAPKLIKRKDRDKGRRTVKDLINRLKSDEWRMKEFQQRIQEIQRSRKIKKNKMMRGRPNFVKKYVENLDYYINKPYLSEKNLKLKRSRMNQIKRNRTTLHQERHEKLVRKIELGEIRREKQMKDLKSRPRRLKMLESQQKLLPLVIFVAFLRKISKVIDNGRAERAYQARLLKSIRIVRKYMLPKILNRRRRMVDNAKAKVKRNLMMMVLVHRIRKKRRYVGIIKNVALSMENSTKFSNQIAMFLNRVRDAQTAIRHHIQKRKAQLFLLTKYFNKLKVGILNKQQEEAKENFQREIEKHVQQLFSSTHHTQEMGTVANTGSRMPKTEKARQRKLNKLAKLQEIIDVVIPPKLIKPRFKENITILLDRLRGQKCGLEELKEAGKIVHIPWKVIEDINVGVRDELIHKDLDIRLKAVFARNEEEEIEEKKSDRSGMSNRSGGSEKGEKDGKKEKKLFFRVLPPEEKFKELVVEAQRVSDSRETRQMMEKMNARMNEKLEKKLQKSMKK